MVQVLLNSVATSGIYLLLALGLVLTFGLGRTANFAHGDFAVWAALIYIPLAGSGGSLAAAGAVLVACLALAATGSLLGSTLFRRLEGNLEAGLLASLGLVFVLQGAATSLWGLAPQGADPFVSGVAEVGTAIIAWQRVLAVVIAATTVLLLWLALNTTRVGTMVRAISEDAEAATALGIPTARIRVGVFGVGALLAGLAGVIYVTLFRVTPFTGEFLVLKAFLVAVLGGASSILGVVVAAFTVGVAEVFGTQYISASFRDAYGLIALVVVLIARPQGIGALQVRRV